MRSVRDSVLIILGLVLVVFPIPISAITYLIQNQLAGTSVSSWVAAGGYLPWVAWEIMLHSPVSLMVLLLMAVAVCGLFVIDHAKESGMVFGDRTPRAVRGGEHGSARWRTGKEIAKAFRRWDPKHGGVSGILIGSAGGLRAWVHTLEQHLMLIGEPGSGKSRRVFLPTIGIIGDAGKESMVITDPKGELFAHAAEWLQSRGYDVVRLDFRNPTSGKRWNPLDKVIQDIKRGDVSAAASSARDIGHILSYSEQPAGGSDSPIWPGLSESLITSVALAIAAGPTDGNPNFLWPTPEQMHLGSAFSLFASISNPADLDKVFAQFHPSHPAPMAYVSVKNSEAETRSSAMTVTTGNMRLFADPSVAWLTSHQDFDMSSVGTKPTAVFLVVPDERSALYPLATLFIKQLLESLTETAQRMGRKLPVRVNFLMDEFGNLPQIPDFDKTVAVSRSRNIRVMIGLQNLPQLEARYGSTAASIKGTMGLWMYLSSSDDTTAKEISERIGTYTYEEYSLSRTGKEHSTQVSRQGRELLKPEEILKWPKGKVLILQSGDSPIRLPLKDLSAYAKVWPELQMPKDEPPLVTVPPISLWLPYQPAAVVPPQAAVQPSREYVESVPSRMQSDARSRLEALRQRSVEPVRLPTVPAEQVAPAQPAAEEEVPPMQEDELRQELAAFLAETAPSEESSLVTEAEEFWNEDPDLLCGEVG